MTTDALSLRYPIRPSLRQRVLDEWEIFTLALLARYARLEIAFWLHVIPLLQESAQLQRLLAWLYPWVKRAGWLSRVPRPARWIGTGLGVGFLIGFLGGLIAP